MAVKRSRADGTSRGLFSSSMRRTAFPDSLGFRRIKLEKCIRRRRGRFLDLLWIGLLDDAKEPLLKKVPIREALPVHHDKTGVGSFQLVAVHQLLEAVCKSIESRANCGLVK